MKNGGFSITSWPTLMIRSAASIARWTKSPADSAAQPRNLGLRLVDHALAELGGDEGDAGLLDQLGQHRGWSWCGWRRRRSPAAATWPSRSASTAARMRFLVGERAADVAASAAASSRSARRRCPRGIRDGRRRAFPPRARRKASRTRRGILSAEASWWVYLVSGRIMSTTSRIWKRPCLELLDRLLAGDHHHRHAAQLGIGARR